MPHATSVPFTGFQAVVLCGPGVSLNTFTANPEDFPKALVPIANRPMVWYPLDWCYRMGISRIHLITPQASFKALDAALSQNPHLTSLPSPKADILCPQDLTHTTPTAEVLRLPEVQAAVTGDFLIVPCDIVCEVPGESFLEAWLTQRSSLEGIDPPQGQRTASKSPSSRRKGGLGVYYETRGSDFVKGAETDFIITSKTLSTIAPSPVDSLRPHISKLLYTTTTDTLQDIFQEKEGFPLRHGLVRKYGRIRMLTTHRDAHIYLFPHWVMEWVKENEKFDSISEDMVGWWAKAGWQGGLAEKLGMSGAMPSTSADADEKSTQIGIDLASMSSTHTSHLLNGHEKGEGESTTSTPTVLAYVHPSRAEPPFPLIRRVDTPHLLLHTSLYIASLPTPADLHPHQDPNPLSHTTKISPEAPLIAPHTTIHSSTTLIAPNTTVATHCTIKNSVIGANCKIEPGAKISGSLLMDGVVVGEKVSLQGCIVGRRAVVGKGAQLRECEIQEGYVVDDGVEAKGEKMSVFEGLDEDGGMLIDEEGSGGEDEAEAERTTDVGDD